MSKENYYIKLFIYFFNWSQRQIQRSNIWTPLECTSNLIEHHV